MHTDQKAISVGKYRLGTKSPVFMVAELSANHNGSLERAKDLVRAAAESGADAIKLQTYTADTMTLNRNDEAFMVKGGTLWDGRSLYDLYAEAMTPWEWHQPLISLARDLGMEAFSSPFDNTAVEFLDDLDVPAFKIASFEITDLPLIRYAAQRQKPMIISTGMATREEIADAVETCRGVGNEEIVLLRCTSAYPAKPEDAHLNTLPELAKAHGVLAGLSDHTPGLAVPVASVALGAVMIEKHFTLDRKAGGPDSAFSMEPGEFKSMVEAVRMAEKALGDIRFGPKGGEEKNLQFRRGLFAVEAIQAGQAFSRQNVRSLRPALGLLPKHLDAITGKKASQNIEAGTPLSWDLVEGGEG
jgi:pseudaminic acid synthase